MATQQELSSTPIPTSGVSDLSARIAEHADKAIVVSQRVTDNAARKLHTGLDVMRDEMPFMLSKVGADADALLADGAERAREASDVVRDHSTRIQQQAAAYVRAQPVTAMLLVAGAAAVLTLLLSGSSRGRR